MTNCPYCGGEIPSKDFAVKSPKGDYWHMPCADMVLDEWVRLKELNQQLLDYIAPVEGCKCEDCVKDREMIERCSLREAKA